MSFIATVENDVIKLPEGLHLPDGTEVVIEPKVSRRRSAAQRYAGFAGIADDMPTDLSRNLDHYLHGQPKRP